MRLLVYNSIRIFEVMRRLMRLGKLVLWFTIDDIDTSWTLYLAEKIELKYTVDQKIQKGDSFDITQVIFTLRMNNQMPIARYAYSSMGILDTNVLTFPIFVNILESAWVFFIPPSQKVSTWGTDHHITYYVTHHHRHSPSRKWWLDVW